MRYIFSIVVQAYKHDELTELIDLVKSNKENERSEWGTGEERTKKCPFGRSIFNLQFEDRGHDPIWSCFLVSVVFRIVLNVCMTWLKRIWNSTSSTISVRTMFPTSSNNTFARCRNVCSLANYPLCSSVSVNIFPIIQHRWIRIRSNWTMNGVCVPFNIPFCSYLMKIV